MGPYYYRWVVFIAWRSQSYNTCRVMVAGAKVSLGEALAFAIGRIDVYPEAMRTQSRFRPNVDYLGIIAI